MKEAIAFYTGILDFEMSEPVASADDWVVILKNGDLNVALLDGTIVNRCAVCFMNTREIQRT